MGKPQGSLVLVEFFDYHCGYCKRAFDELVTLTATEPELKVVFLEFPILSDDSRTAALAALAAARQDRYDAIHAAFMTARGRLTPQRVTEIAGEIGLDLAHLQIDMQDPALIEHLSRNKLFAQKRLAKDIADLMDKAEAADNAVDDDGTRLPEELSRRKTLKAKLDEAAKRLEEEAGKDQDDESAPPPVKADKQINLTDPDSAIMRKSVRHEYQQAYNAQAAVDADATMLVVATDVLSPPNDRAGIEALLDEMEKGERCPDILVADAGYAGETAVNSITESDIEPLISVQRELKSALMIFVPPLNEINRPVLSPHLGEGR